MNEDFILYLSHETIKTIGYLSGPILLLTMIIGLLVSVLQAITQINESTLTFIPKIIAVSLIFIFMSPWMFEIFKNYSIEIFSSISSIKR